MNKATRGKSAIKESSFEPIRVSTEVKKKVDEYTDQHGGFIYTVYDEGAKLYMAGAKERLKDLVDMIEEKGLQEEFSIMYKRAKECLETLQ